MGKPRKTRQEKPVEVSRVVAGTMEEALDRMPMGALFSVRAQVTIVVRGRQSVPEGPVDHLVLDYQWTCHGPLKGRWVIIQAVAVVMDLKDPSEEQGIVGRTWNGSEDEKRPEWVERLAMANLPPGAAWTRIQSVG